jgi:hypothetical protein
MSECRLLNVDRARREAKQLLAAARAGDPAARAQLRPDRPPRLADAQHSVARSHGFRSWSALVHAHDDAGAALRRAARAGDDDAVYALLVGHPQARRLAAAAMDRTLMRRGELQRFGTQRLQAGDEPEALWPVEPATTDEDRSAWGVPPLAVLLVRSMGASLTEPRYGSSDARQAVRPCWGRS